MLWMTAGIYLVSTLAHVDQAADMSMRTWKMK